MKLTRFDLFKPSAAERAAFDCGNDELSAWLHKYASQAMANRDAVVYLLHEDRTIVGYFTLSAGSMSRKRATPRVALRAPDPVPMILLGRLGIHVNHKRRGFGRELVRQALLRAVEAAKSIGARGLMLHAADDEAKNFYHKLGFEESQVSTRHMMITFTDLRATIDHAFGTGSLGGQHTVRR